MYYLLKWYCKKEILLFRVYVCVYLKMLFIIILDSTRNGSLQKPILMNGQHHSSPSKFNVESQNIPCEDQLKSSPVPDLKRIKTEKRELLRDTANKTVGHPNFKDLNKQVLDQSEMKENISSDPNHHFTLNSELGKAKKDDSINFMKANNIKVMI